MRINCFLCGESVSSEVPDGTVFRAIAECPECIQKGGPMENEQLIIEVLMFLLVKGLVPPSLEWPGDLTECAGAMSEALGKARIKLQEG